jgi:hypothetical protein
VLEMSIIGMQPQRIKQLVHSTSSRHGFRRSSDHRKAPQNGARTGQMCGVCHLFPHRKKKYLHPSMMLMYNRSPDRIGFYG